MKASTFWAMICVVTAGSPALWAQEESLEPPPTLPLEMPLEDLPEAEAMGIPPELPEESAVLESPPPSIDLPAKSISTPSLTTAEVLSPYPPYQLHHPTWAVELAVATRALGGYEENLPGRTDERVRAFSIGFEHQPRGLQRLGVLSFGPYFTFYPVTEPGSVGPQTGVAKTALGLFSLGGQIRYQARFFREQILVPLAGYNLEYWNYSLSNGNSGAFLAQGPILGGMLLLNVLEPSAAEEAFISSGVSRTYLVGEARFLTGSDENVSFEGYSLYFGLRFEL